MDIIRKDMESEGLCRDSKKLRQYNINIKSAFYSNLNELHMKFLNENPNINSIEELNLVKKVFDYIKKHA